MNQSDQCNEVQSPAQQMEIVATLVCLGCQVCLFAFGSAALNRIPFYWAKMLVYTLVPLTLTFTILYGSCIHREMTKTIRVLFLLLNSFLIYLGAGVTLAVIAGLAFVYMPVSRFHY